MAENEPTQITERELREAELQMTGRPPASATGLIGFVPAAPASPDGSPPADAASSNGGTGAPNNSPQADDS
jgi:hypothetical protein